MPKVRIQAPLDDGWTWVNDLIVDAARLADGPEYPARPNGQCKSCAFRFMCPAQAPAPLRSRGPDLRPPGTVAASDESAEPPPRPDSGPAPTSRTTGRGPTHDPTPPDGCRSSSRSGEMTSDAATHSAPPTLPADAPRRSSTPSSASPSPTSSGSASAHLWSRS